MITWRDFAVSQAQHQNRLRQAEKERLIKQVMVGSDQPGLWQNIGDLVFRANQKGQPTRDKAQGRKGTYLAKGPV